MLGRSDTHTKHREAYRPSEGGEGQRVYHNPPQKPETQSKCAIVGAAASVASAPLQIVA